MVRGLGLGDLANLFHAEMLAGAIPELRTIGMSQMANTMVSWLEQMLAIARGKDDPALVTKLSALLLSSIEA
ncbi:hypothetical protein COT42_00385 [Candidatus Saganbacteria bacterium CG08_land_8_20_14_0_20_45_16]|uniref:Uncharacterized protein n=1 Tax=Candidatus Saganbacteria bacterium CG08_land_8_20_14_0_20_45_16 TaxID=2014293 RepID=A0A2H0Y1W9_UNCSA|nr:MAG: hypothetical protein COT42_00385 [Candidatus Saganbacteria bacterium CG08_land_8_20_14_0_20_45_16]